MKKTKKKQKTTVPYVIYSLITLIFRSHVIQKKEKKRYLIAIQSSLSPGGSAAVIHSEPAFGPGLAVWGWGLGPLPL